MVSLHNATLATAIQGTFSWVASEDEVDHFSKHHQTLTRLDPGSAREGRGSSFEGLTERLSEAL